jgi:hypothetical protein
VLEKPILVQSVTRVVGFQPTNERVQNANWFLPATACTGVNASVRAPDVTSEFPTLAGNFSDRGCQQNYNP